MGEAPLTLVCFAVKEEARSFTRAASQRPDIRVVLTGMGAHNARSATETALAAQRPSFVLSAGFAGGLRPELVSGAVVFSAEEVPELAKRLLAAGAQTTKFHCVERVAATAGQKQALHKQTGADAVEMESQVIRTICKEKAIPSATVRVILDTANEDLPLDFNALMTPEQKLDGRKLAWALMKSPAKLGALLRLQKQSAAAADQLAKVLMQILPPA
jgi:adenosylhomocysteine nucleosidase